MPPDVPQDGELWEGGGRCYRMEKVVGNGAFGIVWRAREDGSDKQVAIKKVVLDRRYHNRELQMMKVMDHENVVRLRHYFEKGGRKKDETYLHLVMDFLSEAGDSDGVDDDVDEVAVSVANLGASWGISTRTQTTRRTRSRART